MLTVYDKIIYDIMASHRPVESSVVGNFLMYLTGKLPKDYFSERNISTARALERNKENADSPDSNLKLNTFPQLNIEISPSVSESEYSQSDEWYQTQVLRANCSTPLMTDYQGRRHIKAAIDRSVTELTVQILEDSEFKATDLSKYLMRALPFTKKTFLNKCTIGFILPNQLMHTIANSFDLNLNDPDSLEWFKQYIYNSSNGCIRYSLDTASTQHVFTFMYETSIVMEITSVPSVSLERLNKSHNYSELTFEVKLDYPTIPALTYFQEAALDKGVNLNEFINTDKAWRPFVSIPVLALPAQQLAYNDTEGLATSHLNNKFLQLSFYTGIMTGDIDSNVDVTDLSSIIPEYIRDKWRELPDTKKKCRIWSGMHLVDDDDFVLDDECVLEMYTPALRHNWQYRVALYIDGQEYTDADWSKLKDTTPFVS